MTCNECKDQSEKLYKQDIMLAYAERTNKRFFVALMTVVFLFAGLLIYVIYDKTQYEDVSYEQCIEAQQDGAGENIINGGDFSNGTEG